MTVIAYRDGLIACDSMCISGGKIHTFKVPC